MKPGAESDPFDEESPEEQPSDAALSVSEVEAAPGVDAVQLRDQPDEDEPDYPYIMRRKTVKEGRDAVQFYLRPEFADDGERELERRVEDELGADVAITDLREAAYAVAQERPEAVATVLREWGYGVR